MARTTAERLCVDCPDELRHRLKRIATVYRKSRVKWLEEELEKLADAEERKLGLATVRTEQRRKG